VDAGHATPPAVDALDLEVGRGELFGLLGPNGAGKTTTIGMLTTRVVPTGGRAFVDGIDVVAEPARAKEHIGVVTQTNTLDRSLDVRENLEFHARYFGMVGPEARAAADRMLEVMRLTDKAAADVGTLSGGMAQRLMVARAILHRPQVLFLDEPTAGLDPQSRLGLWDVVGELHRDGQTVLLTTHYMEEADHLCERVAIMDHGRILALDQPASLKRSLGVDTVVTVQADGDGDALADALRALEGATGAQVVDGAVRLYVDGGNGILPRVIATAERSGHEVRDVLPLAYVIPATDVHLDVNWPVTLTFLPLAAVLGASLGLTVGTRVEPRQVPLVFSLLVLPMTFLGAAYHPWTSLEPLPWLRWAVLVNPLVYLSEGVRMGLTGDTIPHMNGVVVYAACIAFTAVLLSVGIQGFRRRVLS
jgi:ABC-2 type transport system ATP-binding protein